MSTWTKLPPHRNPHIGCLNCGGGEMRRRGKSAPITCALVTKLYQGFGGWHIERDGKTWYRAAQIEDGRSAWRNCRTLRWAERRARLDPDHDWRAVCDLPLRSATYQRQGRNRWVLVASGPGFA